MMTAGQFLRAIWPSSGNFCTAYPIQTDSGKPAWSHHVFQTITEAVSFAHEKKHIKDMYFAMFTLEQPKVWDPTKPDYKTGVPGGWTYRKKPNMLQTRVLYLDIDVDKGPNSYPAQRDALIALAVFVKKIGLPEPLIVNSGYGVHVYWRFPTPISSAEWQPMADQLQALAVHHKLHVDPAITTDCARILRIPETINHKFGKQADVTVLAPGVETSVDHLRKVLSDAVICDSVEVEATKAPRLPVMDNGLKQQTFNDFGPPPKLGEVVAACGQVRNMIRAHCEKGFEHYGRLHHNAWYKGFISTVAYLDRGEDICRDLTKLWPRNKSDVEAKIVQTKTHGPSKCSTIEAVAASEMPWGDSPCRSCKWRDDASVPNPLVAARRGASAPQPTMAPPPPPVQPLLAAVPPAPNQTLFAALLPNPPHPYKRTPGYGITLTQTDKDGNEKTSVIYPNDLYPLKRLLNHDTGTEQQVWRVVLPRTGSRDFTIDADVLYDSRKFNVAIANNGLYPNKADIPALQDYMVAYIKQLQKDMDGEVQKSHLGWTDDCASFVAPDKTFMPDGSVRQTSLTTAAQRAAQHITRKGDLQRQVELLRFYNNPAYVGSQFAILAALGSILFHFTGHHGVVVNMSGTAGASKSTTLYTAASLFGHPKLWSLNGTNQGATMKGRAQRIATSGNYPTCVDEITHMGVKDVNDMVMGITQPNHRLRLQSDGTEQAMPDGYKSAIMLSTANSSLHSVLSLDNTAGTAGSMRVVELKFVKTNVHTKAEADTFLREIEQNYGWIGEAFIAFVVRNIELVRNAVQRVMQQIDEEAGIQAAERFWSAPLAVALVACDIANALGLLDYDRELVHRWYVDVQIPYMRGVVSEEYRTPLAILTDYIAEKHSNIVVVDRTSSMGVNTGGAKVPSETSYVVGRPPSGPLLGHYDMKSQTLYLLKQAFKEHCGRIGAASTRVLDDLYAPREAGARTLKRIVPDRSARRTLGAGTELAKGQSWCFAVDMSHPEISGATPLSTVQGGAQAPTAPAGNLRSVP